MLSPRTSGTRTVRAVRAAAALNRIRSTPMATWLDAVLTTRSPSQNRWSVTAAEPGVAVTVLHPEPGRAPGPAVGCCPAQSPGTVAWIVPSCCRPPVVSSTPGTAGQASGSSAACEYTRLTVTCPGSGPGV